MEAKRAQKAARRAPAKRKLFSECASEYITAHRASWKSVIHARQWEQTLDDYVLPVIGKLPAADVGPSDVKRVLASLWRTKPEVARKVCGKVGMILNYAIADGAREAPNCASLIIKAVLGPLQQKVRHHPALPFAQVPGLAKSIGNRTDVPSLALMWLIASATRSSCRPAARQA